MTHDFEQIQAIADAGVGRTGSELTFPFPEVLEVIKLCTSNEIAVLGVEIFLVKSDGYHGSGCSDYDLQLMRKWPVVRAPDWCEYLRENNALAEECVHRNPAGDDHVYILTTSSWREFCEIQKMKQGHRLGL